MGKAASDLNRALLVEIRAYLEAVKVATGWKQGEMARRAGYSDHSPISKAFALKHRMMTPALLALQDQSGVPMPSSLHKAILADQLGPPKAPLEGISATLEDIKRMSKAQREALLAELIKDTG